MSEDQISRLEGKLDTVSSNMQQLMVDMAALKSDNNGSIRNVEQRVTSLEAFRESFNKIFISIIGSVAAAVIIYLILQRPH